MKWWSAGVGSGLIFVGLLVGAAGVEVFEGCRLVDAEWADGDSFPVRTAEGREFTIRLYGVDCVEPVIRDDSDGRRLRDQRRHFGIAEAGGSVESSRELALQYGRLASVQVAEWLAEPFEVATAFADGRGDPRYSRFYGFVRSSDGRDLGEALVGAGLARAHGVYRAHPDGRSAAEYKSRLSDLELRAARFGRGVWAATDWERLVGQRADMREELEEIRPGAAPPQKLDPNVASRDELMTLPGIGEVIALRIVEHRPYEEAEDMLRVPGIGEATLERMVPFLDFSGGEGREGGEGEPEET